ncbi:hypothetical protein DTO207G8_4328 [Paecilomyces variotii]|nr:hypothetical protein DTO207G8_4328 [Paecilomyces variotii]KAJ9297691.1 hypothetical protein DTO217A2_8586 [Paecilomyces variotii]KAJ9372980.1 hypothetical protein DTO282E5_2390 [Paecilomyces variotii]
MSTPPPEMAAAIPRDTLNESKSNNAASMAAASPGGTVQDSMPTDSHALAVEQIHPDQDEKGIVQKAGATTGLTDVGWNRRPDDVDSPLVAGWSNEDLWMLIRRFNKQIYRVKAVPEPPMAALDLNVADDEEFSPDKLRSKLERLYVTVIVSLIAAGKHIVRLRSWREPRRTAAFCAVYFLAWLLDLLTPTLLGTVLVLIMYPPSRKLLFPPAPLALVDSKTGSVKTPKAGVLGSHDSVTGAPEKHRGEAVEQEASNLVSSVASVAVGSAVGKHDQGTPEDDPIEGSAPDPTDVVASSADAASAGQGAVPSDAHDKTREPMKKEVWEKVRPVMRILNDVCDTWEKFENALSPKPPFSKYAPLRLAGVLLPAFLGSLVTPCYVFVKMSTFFVGFGFFGDPIIRRGMTMLNHRFPHWEKLLELRNTLLKGIPTNAQLAITLLRIGEANGAPLPPPPGSELEKAPSRPASLNKEEIPLDASHHEIEQAATGQTAEAKQITGSGNDQKSQQGGKQKKGFMSSVVAFIRGTTAKSMETKLAVDRARAAVGSKNAKNHIGVLSLKGQQPAPGGPVEFEARYKGKRGAIVVDTSKKPAVVYFTTKPVSESEQFDQNKKSEKEVVFSMPIDDIQELKKVGGIGWKGKLLVGWAERHKEVIDGLILSGPDPQRSYHVTAMKSRDYLFNRLIAINGQVWQTY